MPAAVLGRRRRSRIALALFYFSPPASSSPPRQVPAASVGRVIRGDWYVTSGDVLSAKVTISLPDGKVAYTAGPDNAEWDGDDPDEAYVSEGAFKFVAPAAGTYRLDVENPSPSAERGIALAWLLGRDDDDPFTARGANLTGAISTLKKQTSHVHKKIDELTALMQYADVRYRRHLQTAESTNKRITRFTLLETAAIALSTALSVLFVRRLEFRKGGYLPRAAPSSSV